MNDQPMSPISFVQQYDPSFMSNTGNPIFSPPRPTQTQLPTQDALSNIGNLVGQGQSVLGQSGNTPAQQPTSKQPNTFEKFLPTLGGILGGLGAGALDVVSGGAAIPFDAAIAGAGSALGKAGENALTGQKVLQGNVLSSGLEGAAGQVAGEGLGSILGKIGDVAGNRASSLVQTAEDAKTADAIKQLHTAGVTNPSDEIVASVKKMSPAGPTSSGGKFGGMTPLDIASIASEGLKGNPALGALDLGLRAYNNPTAMKFAGSGLSGLGSSAAPGILSQVVANSPNFISQAGAGSAINPGITGAPNMQNSLLGQTLQQDLTAGQEALTDPFLAGNFSSQIGQMSALLPLAQKIAAAQQAVQSQAALVNQAGGAQGPLGGFMSQLGQTLTGGPGSLFSNALNQQNQATTNALNAVQPGLAGPAPQITQNQATAQAEVINSLNKLNAMLSNYGVGGQSTSSAPQQ